jgi:hypothetical protein
MILLPLLTGVGVFALVGLVWNIIEGLNEQERQDPPPRP